MKKKWLIIGLGNPGGNYSHTRHNAGFLILDEIAKNLNISFCNEKFSGVFAKYETENEECYFGKPLTYMNRSGLFVKNFIKKYNIPMHNVIVLHDDIAFPVGVSKIKLGGSSGGHKGINSIIEECSSQDFIRVRIGVGENSSYKIIDWVVSCFDQKEEQQILSQSDKIQEAISLIISNQLTKAMNEFNSKKNNTNKSAESKFNCT